jgi:predicted esterase YcpF (UPF0227 family)
MDELRAMAVRVSRPQRYFLLVETADELLDYREAVAFYAGAYQYVRGGGDHAFTDFEAQVPAILRFAQGVHSREGRGTRANGTHSGDSEQRRRRERGGAVG